MNAGDTVEIDFFFGKKFLLSGVDYFGVIESGSAANGIRFCLDAVIYEAIENEDDGYRSSMKEIRVVNTPVINRFSAVEVLAISPGDSGRACVSFCDTTTGKGVLEVGTDYSNDCYPSFVASFSPENMCSNQQQYETLKKAEALLLGMRGIRTRDGATMLDMHGITLTAGSAETPPNPWKEVLLDALIDNCILRVKNESNPKQALTDLIAWEVSGALDPLISEAAQDLIDRGKAEAVAGLKSISISESGGNPYAVAAEATWRYDAAPRGAKIFLLTEGGVAVEGIWRDDGGFIAWHPLFKRDKELEKQLGLLPY